MGYYIDQNNNYYEGDKADHRHIEVEKRISPLHVFDSEGNQSLSADKVKEYKLKQLKNTDDNIIRGIEDIYDILISKNIIKKSDMPIDFIEKLKQRKILRAEIQE